jgi:hypothetical protein
VEITLVDSATDWEPAIYVSETPVEGLVPAG